MRLPSADPDYSACHNEGMLGFGDMIIPGNRLIILVASADIFLPTGLLISYCLLIDRQRHSAFVFRGYFFPVILGKRSDLQTLFFSGFFFSLRGWLGHYLLRFGANEKRSTSAALSRSIHVGNGVLSCVAERRYKGSVEWESIGESYALYDCTASFLS